MIKPIRNVFGEKKVFMNNDNQIIDFNFETEGAHLANKLRKQHICNQKQKMKVKLAIQLISQSVTGAEATIKFIEIFNAGHKIILGKKAMCEENYAEITDFANVITKYSQCLKVKENNNFIPILESNRRTGFIGFIVLIAARKLNHIKLHKVRQVSQDHLEFFFGNIRSLAAYKKLVIRLNNIPSFNFDNCISFEHIDILHDLSTDLVRSLIFTGKQQFLNSFINLKNQRGEGGLVYPSDDFINILCLFTEKNFEILIIKIKPKESLSSLSDHVTLLIKSISTTYIKLKINHSVKQLNEKPSLCLKYNKLTLFQAFSKNLSKKWKYLPVSLMPLFLSARILTFKFETLQTAKAEKPIINRRQSTLR
ncbi:hypothetical protein AGLY_010577 [Aphis glycines]|uniref:Transposable element P transposase-like GTP-binding insertion domain-containing protein n=1 Tax=Aphis glycines TaxID=307491 RepID=A0A6G0TEV0_APHGL|nr:hypothetical protein AGLY_010577 [Aphis glycines]